MSNIKHHQSLLDDSMSSVLSLVLDARGGRKGGLYVPPAARLFSWAKSREEERACVFPGRGGGEGGAPSFFCKLSTPLIEVLS